MVRTDYIQKIRWSEKRIERTYKYNSVFTLTNNRKKKNFFPLLSLWMHQL